MLIVGISGSPRQNKNCDQIIDHALKFFENKDFNTKAINLSQQRVNPCLHCDACKKQKSCPQKDETNQINKNIERADAILVASPVYFGSITGQLKSLFDRTLPLRRNGFTLKSKIGAAFTIGGSRNGGQELAIQNIQSWMLIHGMIIVGDNNHFGGTLQNPWLEDKFGQETISGTLNSVLDLLTKIKA